MRSKTPLHTLRKLNQGVVQGTDFQIGQNIWRRILCSRSRLIFNIPGICQFLCGKCEKRLLPTFENLRKIMCDAKWVSGAKFHRVSWFLGRSPFCIRGDATSGRPMALRALAGGLNPTLHQATNSLGAPELCRSGSTGRPHTTLRIRDRVLRCMGFLVFPVNEFFVNQLEMVNGLINLHKIYSVFDLDFKGRTLVQIKICKPNRKNNRNNNCGIKRAHSEGV